MPELSGINIPFVPAGGVRELNRPQPTTPQTSSGVNFNDIFQEELQKLKFSGHAKTRMQTREITISDAEMLRLESAVNKANSKGANESLVIMDEKAFIVSVANKTVITAMDKSQLEQDVITNIDSVVFA